MVGGREKDMRVCVWKEGLREGVGRRVYNVEVRYMLPRARERCDISLTNGVWWNRSYQWSMVEHDVRCFVEITMV